MTVAQHQDTIPDSVEVPRVGARRHPTNDAAHASYDALDAADTTALPARREPVLSDTGGDRERRRLDDRDVQPGATRRYPEGNWIQTTEGMGRFVLLRLYRPLVPFVDKSWRPSEIEAVKTDP